MAVTGAQHAQPSKTVESVYMPVVGPTTPTAPCCVLHGNTKGAQHVIDSRHPGGCPVQALASYASRLSLLTFLLPEDAPRLRHWLRHYVHHLGVHANRTFVAVRLRRGTANESLDATRAAMVEFGVPVANLQQHRAPPSDALKLAVMNAHINSLPAAHWHVYADVDELHDYPCGLRLGSKSTCVTGTMWDQMASNGNITALTDEPSLEMQYPLQCRVRASVPHMWPTKYSLVRVDGGTSSSSSRLSYLTTHVLNGTCRHAAPSLTRHYSMTVDQMVNMRQKAALQNAELAAGAARPGSVDANTKLSMPCGFYDTKLGRCRDYMIQLEYMERAIARAEHKRPSVHQCPHGLDEMINLTAGKGYRELWAKEV